MFKVGDKVYSIRPESSVERKSSPQWVREMDETIGVVGNVNKILIHSNQFIVYFSNVKTSYQFKFTWLKQARKNIG